MARLLKRGLEREGHAVDLACDEPDAVVKAGASHRSGRWPHSICCGYIWRMC